MDDSIPMCMCHSVPGCDRSPSIATPPNYPSSPKVDEPREELVGEETMEPG